MIKSIQVDPQPFILRLYTDKTFVTKEVIAASTAIESILLRNEFCSINSLLSKWWQDASRNAQSMFREPREYHLWPEI